MKKVRHVLGISGGKDSAALAIYMKNKFPLIDIDYYTSDTGKELDETYKLIENLESYLEKKITVLKGAEGNSQASFDHFLMLYGGYLPSTQARWCTKKLKLEPFERFVGNDPVVSYVGIRGDEDREGYISKKQTIQSIFPFRKNIWSEDVVQKFLHNKNIDHVIGLTNMIDLGALREPIINLLRKPIDSTFTLRAKTDKLLSIGVKDFNYLVFEYLKQTDYPLASEIDYRLLDNEEVIVKSDVFKILEDSGVGIPAYYKSVEFKSDDNVGTYSRSRSGCFFCFYQQKIEWVWLFEQHHDLFVKAMEYEKEGYNWNQEESLLQLTRPERIQQIKNDHIKKQLRMENKKSTLLLDILDDDDEVGCASCFI